MLEDMDCSYVLGLPTNARLKAMAAPWAEDAATRRALHDKDSVRPFYQARYAARSWRRERRIVARGAAPLKWSTHRDSIIPSEEDQKMAGKRDKP